MPSKSLNSIFILTCKDYATGNAALQGLAGALESALNLKVRLCVWQELNLKDLSAQSLILPLAVWDYSLEYEKFISFLKECQNSGALCLNPYEILKENSQKTYLKKLESLNLPVPKSLFLEPSEPRWLEKILNFKAQFSLEKLVLKPVIGQSGKGVALFDESMSEEILRQNYGALLAQEFLGGVFEGEFCLVFFNKKFQYAVKRELKSGDFRANSAYGVEISAFKAPFKMIEIAQNALNALTTNRTCLYARIDLIKAQGLKAQNEQNADYILNEAELIEPSLYFDKDKNAYENFTQSLKEMLN